MMLATIYSSNKSLVWIALLCAIGIIALQLPAEACTPEYDQGTAPPDSESWVKTDQTEWMTGSIDVAVGQTVYFKGTKPDGTNLPSADKDTINTVNTDQGTDTLRTEWDFNYVAPTFDVNSRKLVSMNASKVYSTTGTRIVKLRTNDLPPPDTVYNDSAVLAQNQITVNVFADAVWYVGDAITGSISSPVNNYGYACNSEVTFSLESESAGDSDHRHAPGETPTDTYPEDSLTCTWTAKAGETNVGTFPSGNVGESVTWIAPEETYNNVTVTCTISDAAQIPSGEGGSRDDDDKVVSVSIKVYKIACLLVEAKEDEDIYWSGEPHTSDKIWGASQSTFESNGTIVEDWLRPRIADIFQPGPKYYKLVLSHYRYPACTTTQSPTTTIIYHASSEDLTGWNPYVWVTNRSSVGRRATKMELTFEVGNRQVGTQEAPGGTEFFIDYAIWDNPECPAVEFTRIHLYDATTWGEGQSTEDDIADQVFRSVNGKTTDGCICGMSFHYIWKGARGSTWVPLEEGENGHDEGMCDCRAKGMIEVMQVLGFNYLQDFVNELSEPNTSRDRPLDQTCYAISLHYGKTFMRAGWGGGVWNNWQGVAKKADGAVCYSPQWRHKATYEVMNDAPNWPTEQDYSEQHAFQCYSWIRFDDQQQVSHCTHLPTPP